LLKFGCGDLSIRQLNAGINVMSADRMLNIDLPAEELLGRLQADNSVGSDAAGDEKFLQRQISPACAT
jgi:hypothetical protein